MSGRTRTRARATVLFVAPVVFLAGGLAHPFVRTYLETGVVAEAIIAVPGRWVVSHLILALGIGFILSAALVIRDRLREAGEERWSGRATTGMYLYGMAILVACWLVGYHMVTESADASVASSGTEPA